ncbi:serine protease [Desulfopila sp. IMCC35008]|uniref:S1 family peptidase n=1 Tax=Desulfopila sp. IMCC35008 TaxID=2653858 RepID=UPI0013D4256C|nr:serine protease [Desulfopila sp. IMCC35008]
MLLLLWPVMPVGAVVPETEGIRWHVRVVRPVSETLYEVMSWMADSGLGVEKKDLQDGKVLVTGIPKEKNGQEWRVTVSPYSALGSEVSVEITGGVDEVLVAAMRSALESGKAGGTQDVSETSVLPSPVLGQIEHVACIHAEAAGRSVQFSGFFIDDEGLILCTAHDLLEHERVKVMSNTGLFYEGDVVKADFEKDLALIRVDAVKEEAVRVGEGRNLLVVGERVYSIGCPMNMRGTIHTGFINGPPRKIGESFLWQAGIEVQPGGSGSPVFDINGSLVGVVKGRHREAGDLGFILPLEAIVDFLQEYFDQ